MASMTVKYLFFYDFPKSLTKKVTDNYFPPAMVMPREERRDWLSSHYMFRCCCNACAIDQPNIRLPYI